MRKNNYNINIFLFTKLFPPDIGGVPTYYSNLLKNISLPVTVVTRNRDVLDKYNGVENKYHIKMLDLPKNLSFRLSSDFIVKQFQIIYWMLIQHLSCKKKRKIYIVGQARFFFLFPCWILKVIFGADYIVWLHGEEVPIIGRMTKSQHLEAIFLKKSSYAICNSKFTKMRFKKLMPKYQNPIEICYPGVEDHFLEFKKTTKENQSRLRNLHDLQDKRIIYTIARLDERKGHDKVIESLTIVKEKFPNIVYLIGGVGPEERRLKMLVRELGLEKYIRFLGLIDRKDIVAYHDIGELFIMPNRILDDGDSEGFGIVFIEANARRRPVIGGNVGGSLDAIIDGNTGILVDSIDPKNIAEKICILLDDKNLREKLGDNGRIRAEKEFRWQNISNKIEKKIVSFINEV